MKNYILTLSLVFISVFSVVFLLLSFLFATFDPAQMDSFGKGVSILVTLILTGVLTERLREIK